MYIVYLEECGKIFDVVYTYSGLHVQCFTNTAFISHDFLGQAEEMVKEWISLVVERDRLLREQLDKVNTRTTMYSK